MDLIYRMALCMVAEKVLFNVNIKLGYSANQWGGRADAVAAHQQPNITETLDKTLSAPMRTDLW